MRQLQDVVRSVVEWFAANQVQFALIGGLAVSFRTIERFTKDLDLVIAVESDEQAERYVRELTRIGLYVDRLLEQAKHGRIATVRMSHGSENGVLVDLLFASSGIEAEIIASAEPVEIFDGLTVPIASVAGLLALKTLSVDPVKRPQDVIDIRNLLIESNEQDIVETIRLLRLVQSRGYHRGKDLLSEFNRYQMPNS